MTKQELLFLIGRYGGLRDDASYYQYHKNDKEKGEQAIAKATECFTRISKELTKLYKEKE